MYLKRIKYKGLILYIIYCIAMLGVAYLFDRFFQMLMFILFFDLIQNSFLKRFHADTLFEREPIKAVKYCKVITFVVELIYLVLCKDLDISIYSNLLIIFIIAFINALLQFYCERIVVSKVALSDRATLTTLCQEAGLTGIATKRMIMKYVDKMTYREIADIECVDEESIKKSISRSRKKLKIQ